MTGAIEEAVPIESLVHVLVGHGTHMVQKRNRNGGTHFCEAGAHLDSNGGQHMFEKVWMKHRLHARLLVVLVPYHLCLILQAYIFFVAIYFEN